MVVYRGVVLDRGDIEDWMWVWKLLFNGVEGVLKSKGLLGENVVGILRVFGVELGV